MFCAHVAAKYKISKKDDKVHLSTMTFDSPKEPTETFRTPMQNNKQKETEKKQVYQINIGDVIDIYEKAILHVAAQNIIHAEEDQNGLL